MFPIASKQVVSYKTINNNYILFERYYEQVTTNVLTLVDGVRVAFSAIRDGTYGSAPCGLTGFFSLLILYLRGGGCGKRPSATINSINSSSVKFGGLGETKGVRGDPCSSDSGCGTFFFDPLVAFCFRITEGPGSSVHVS